MKLSLCIICKNEEDNILKCINSVKSIVDEVVVVDTGSTDKTIEIAQEQGAIIYSVQWNNDFANVRNYALNKATGDWIIFLDADEYIYEECVQYVKPCIEQCIEKDKNTLLSELINVGESGIIDVATTLRIFKNGSGLHYVGKIHERLVSSDFEAICSLDARELLTVYHTGYSKKEVEKKDKFTRNELMLLEELKKEDRCHQEYGISDIHYYLTEVYEAKKDDEKLMFHAKKALEQGDFRLLGTHQKAYCNILKKMLKTEDEELEGYYKESIELDPMYPDFEWYYGEYLLKKGDIAQGVTYLERCIEKIECYQGMVQSYLMLQIHRLYHMASEQYMKLEQYDKALIKLVKLLKADKYDYAALKKLLQILQGKERIEDIGGFLANIYDYGNSKDRLVLVQVSKALGSEIYYKYFYEILTQEEKEMVS